MTDVVQARKVGAKTHGSGDGSAGRVRHEPLQQSEQMSDLEGLHLSEAGVLPPPKPARRPWLWAVMGTVTTAAIAAGIAYYVHSLSFESTDDAFIDGHIIPVSSRVAGHVAKVCITDNQQVQEGDLLAELDAADFETRLAAAEAAWQAAQAAGKARTTAVASATAELEQSKADLMAAETREERTKAHWKRIESLVPEHAASQDSLEEAAAVARVARAETAAMREKVNAKQLAIEQAKSAAAAADGSVRQAEAEREQARLNRSYTKLFAPISGYVTRKSVEAGAFVQVGQPLLALVDPDVWVVANFKETQLTKMRPGQPVVVTVDSHADLQFAAHVDSLQRGSGARFSLLPPENATGNYVKVVQRVPVKIVFDDPRQLQPYALGPGMSVVPTVDIHGSGGEDASMTMPALQSR